MADWISELMTKSHRCHVICCPYLLRKPGRPGLAIKGLLDAFSCNQARRERRRMSQARIREKGRDAKSRRAARGYPRSAAPVARNKHWHRQDKSRRYALQEANRNGENAGATQTRRAPAR